MDLVRILLSRCAALFRRDRLDEDLDEELRAHIDLAAEENVKRGMSAQEARNAALREFGGVTQTKEAYRTQRGFSLLAVPMQDVRFGVRQLAKAPGFTFISLLTLALGIGATTAIFSVVDAVMLKPLPFSTADRLVQVGSTIAATGAGGTASYLDFVDMRAQNHVFDGMAAFRTGDFTWIGRREPVLLQGAAVSAQLFSLLAVTPALGRSFRAEEDSPAATGGTDPVILSYGVWQREFGSDASALGRTMQLGNQTYTVIGVMPKGFQFPIQAEPVEIWTTIAVDGRGGANAMIAQRGAHYLDVIGLLKPGVSIQQAQAEMAAIAGALSKQHPENKARTVRLAPLLESLVGNLRAPLIILMGAVGCVLLIVCVNIANLLLARATARRMEVAVRMALGASRRRVFGQLLTESLLLGLVGGGLGIAVALELTRVLVGMMPVEIPRLNGAGLDTRLLIFAALVSMLAGVLFGIVPALQAAKVGLTESLQKAGRNSAGEDTGSNCLRSSLVVSEVAMAVTLLLGAGLLLQSFVHMTQADPGFDPHHVLTFQIDAPAGMDRALWPGFYRDVVARIGALPGVTSASAALLLPLMGDNIRSSIEIEGQPTPIGSRPSADFNAVAPNYLHTVGTALVEGRDFNAVDDSSSTPVVIVNRKLARLYFPNQNPIGKHVRPGIGNGYGSGEPPMREIVGVVEDVKQSGPASDTDPAVYAPLAQSPFDSIFIAARTESDPAMIVTAARQQVASLNKNVPIYHVKTLDQYFADSVAEPRFISLLLGGFAMLAVLLACLGVYGVVSYAVVQRTHEIGIRMALGADGGSVVRAVLSRGMRLAAMGVAIGLAGSFALVHLLSSQLFGVRATDPMTFAGAALALLCIAAMASYIPARRAAGVNPMAALRNE
jgi:putative ABC transport system permease protein